MSKIKSLSSNKNMIATSMLLVGILMPLSQIPQIITLYSTKVTTGLSLETWIMYLVFCLVPIAYGVAYRLPPLIISNLLWTIVNIVMITGIIKYGLAADDSSFDSLVTINYIGKFLSILSLICMSSALALFSHDLFMVDKK